DALRQQAFFLMLLTRHDEAVEVLERSLAAAEAAGNASGCARALSILGTVEDHAGRVERSWRRHDEAVRRARKSGTDLDLAMALTNLAVTAFRNGRLDDATSAHEEAAL